MGIVTRSMGETLPLNFPIFNIENYQKKTDHENLVISILICMETHKRVLRPVPHKSSSIV